MSNTTLNFRTAESSVNLSLPPSSSLEKFAYVDALRGIAIIMVIASHAGNAYPLLPWPLRALTNYGFYGVQLFFVVSCFTLVKSWNSRSWRELSPTRNFFIRRFFRILPMYATAAAVYGWALPPGNRFSWPILLTTFGFANGWSPWFLGTVDGSWVVVPGGWSITAEFSFYALFPLVVTWIDSIGRAVFVLLTSLIAAYIANGLAFDFYVQEYGAQATDQFIYYWLPNQFSVFCFGFLGFFLVGRLKNLRNYTTVLSRWQMPLSVLLILIAGSLAFLPIARTIGLTPPFLPGHIFGALIFLGLLCLLSLGGRNILVNKATIAMGRVSFSAYLIHFGVIRWLEEVLPTVLATGTTGISAILRCGLLLTMSLIITFCISEITYRLVEEPTIRWGHVLCKRLENQAKAKV